MGPMSDGNEYTVQTARQAGERDELEEWVTRFLASPGSDNAALAEQLCEPRRWWLGPVELPIDQLHRLAGPADQPVLEVVEEDDWRDDVDDLAERIEEDEDWEPPPSIVSFRKNGQLVLEDGNHRVEALRRTGEKCTWAIVCFEDPEERDRFVVPTPTG